MDYEEMMLQISDVMRHANRLRPIMTHEEAVKSIRKIVNPSGKWTYTDGRWGLGDWQCSNCDGYTDKDTYFCPNCGADMRGGV